MHGIVSANSNDILEQMSMTTLHNYACTYDFYTLTLIILYRMARYLPAWPEPTSSLGVAIIMNDVGEKYCTGCYG